MLSKGDLVKHRKFGIGTVLGFRHRRAYARVSFGRFRLWIRAHELERIGDGIKLVGPEGERANARNLAPATRPLKANPTLSFSRKSDMQKMQILESLRTGLVPKSAIEQWTFGRDDEVREVRHWLHDLAEGAILIEGGYGMGKSHLLAYLEHIAWHEGYAVAFTGYDPAEATAAFPKRFYRNLVSTLVVPHAGSAMNFREFMHELQNRGGADFFKGHTYLGAFMQAMEAGELDEADWEWLEGRDTYSKRFGFLYDHRTAANIYCNLLSALSVAMVEFMGLKGLLILVDEAEVIRAQRYQYQVEGALNLMRGLAMVSNDDPVFLEEKVVRIEGAYKGKETGLMYSGFMPGVRYIHQVPTYMKIAYALTPTEVPGFHKMRQQMPVIHLSSLKRSDIEALFRQLVNTYKEVYDLVLDKQWQNRLLLEALDLFDPGVHPLRLLVKSLVEAMDIMRFYPETGLEDIFESAHA